MEDLREAQTGERSLLGEFDYDSAAAGERRSELPCGHEQREVPWDDLRDDADGLAKGVGVEVAGEGDGEGFAGDLGGPAAHVTEHIDGERYVCDASDGE